MTTLPTYSQQRDEMDRTFAAQAPAELLNGFAAAVKRLEEADFAARAPQVGDEAPEFVLPDHDGDPVQLSALLRRGPAVVIFYRGEWCPYCNLQLRTFQAHLGELRERGAQLVAISPETPDHSLSMAEKNDLEFLVLSDPGAHVVDRYGLRYVVDQEFREIMESVGNDIGAHNGDAGWVLPATATFVIDPEGVVRYARVSGDWTQRAEPREVLDVLAGLS